MTINGCPKTCLEGFAKKIYRDFLKLDFEKLDFFKTGSYCTPKWGFARHATKLHFLKTSFGQSVLETTSLGKNDFGKWPWPWQ